MRDKPESAVLAKHACFSCKRIQRFAAGRISPFRESVNRLSAMAALPPAKRLRMPRVTFSEMLRLSFCAACQT